MLRGLIRSLRQLGARIHGITVGLTLGLSAAYLGAGQMPCASGTCGGACAGGACPLALPLRGLPLLALPLLVNVAVVASRGLWRRLLPGAGKRVIQGQARKDQAIGGR